MSGPLFSACWCLSGSAAQETSSEHLRAPFPCACGPPPAWEHPRAGSASPPYSQPCGLCCGPRRQLDQGGLVVCAPSPPHRLLGLQWWKVGFLLPSHGPCLSAIFSLIFWNVSCRGSAPVSSLQVQRALSIDEHSTSLLADRQTDRQTDITEVHTRNSKGIFCTSPNSTYCPRLGHTSSCSLQPTLSGPIPQPVDLITSGQFSGVAAVSPVSSDALKLTGSRMSFSSLYLLTCQPRAAHPAGAGHLEIGQ